MHGQIIGPTIATSKVVYVTTTDDWVLGYSTSTGKQVWSGMGGAGRAAVFIWPRRMTVNGVA